jgi:hypothetical protein
MKKWIFSLALTFSLSLANQSLQHEIVQSPLIPAQKFLEHEIEYLAPASVNTGHLTVKAMKIDGFDGEKLEKLNAAFQVLERVVNSEEFKDRVINFENKQGKREFASNRNLTNEEIYTLFMEGRETLQPNTPGVMNFYLKLYNRSWSRVIGYTSGNTNLININWKFFKNFTPAQVASNLAHEWTHKMGFDHKSAKEHDSAPYAIGTIVGDIASRLLNKKKLH